MCELMGLCFAQPISADFSIREFALSGVENADGWGLAWYPDHSVAVVKEPIEWQTSTYTGFLETYQRLLSSIYIAHVRHKTLDHPPTHADTHPFARELEGYDYCFAHNGSLTGLIEKFALGRYRPVGHTDSEYAFCHILDEAARTSDFLASQDGWRWLHAKLTALNALGHLNCLMSDGRRLFAYHDTARYKGLCLRKIRIHSHETRRFEDADVKIDLATEQGEPVNHGYVIATRPLSPTGWHSFEPGELVVLEEGGIQFSSHPARRTKSD
jgi:predicted glutamine amidotransferase